MDDAYNNSGKFPLSHEILTRFLGVYFGGLHHATFRDHHMDNGSVCSFTDTDELNVTNLLALKIT
jgi:broad specificity phosphatase PhoE